MRTRQRVVAFVAALLGIISAGVVAAPTAHAYTPITCQTRTHTLSSAPHPNMSYYWPGGWWKWGRYYVSQCRHGVRWDPSGWRYTSDGNLQVRIRTYNGNGNTWYVTDWKNSLGSGNTVVVAGFVQPGTQFSIEARVLGLNSTQDDRPDEWWPLGQIEF